MAENDTPPKKDAKQNEKNAESKDVGAGAAPKKAGMGQMIMAGALLVGMAVGSASLAVVVASMVVHPPKAQASEAKKNATETAHAADAKAESGEKEKQTERELAIAEPLIVNVYQTQQRRYLSVKPVFVFSSKEVTERVKSEKLVELQHLLIGILKSKTLDQLDDPDAANTIGREIQEAVNLKFELSNALEAVNFIQFVVQ